LTELIGGPVYVTHFPLMEIPFYHAKEDGGDVDLALNADLILPGYREVAGSGARIASQSILEHKAKLFNLPMDDYSPYVALRALPQYKQTAGFGLGWQRYTQWILKLPTIWDATLTPRGSCIPFP